MSLRKLFLCLITLSIGSYTYSMQWAKDKLGKTIGEVGAGATKAYLEDPKTHEAFHVHIVQPAVDKMNEVKDHAKKAAEEMVENAKLASEKMKQELEEQARKANEEFKKNTKEASEKFKDSVLKPTVEEAHKFKDSTVREADRLVDRLSETIKTGALCAVGGAAAIFSIWYAYKYLWSHVEKSLHKPFIPVQSVQPSFFGRIKNFFKAQDNSIPRRLFFAPALKDRLQSVLDIAVDTAQRIQAGDTTATYSNLLLWGPSGTGKRSYAQQFTHELSKAAHMDYIFLDGAFFAPVKNGAPLERIDALFEKVQNSSRNTIIFIDQAKFLLSKHHTSDVIMERFLKYTKERSNKYMIIFSTSAIQIAKEVMGIIGDSVEMGLPELPEMIDILKHYRDTLLLNNPANPSSLIESARQTLVDESIETLARELKGFSCRDLENIIKAIQEKSRRQDYLVSTYVIKAAIAEATKKYQDFKENLPHQYAAQAA